MEEQRMSDFTYRNYETDTFIAYNVHENGTVDILDSYLIKDDKEKMEFIKDLQENGSVNFGKRSDKSLLVEWKAHNILYKKGWFKKRTRDTGLNPKESYLRRAFYWLIFWIFEEK